MTDHNKSPLSFEQIDNAFEKTVQSFLNDMYPTTSSNILSNRAEDLNQIIGVHKGYKYQAISKEVEYEANCFLLMQCALSCLRSTFLMLKKFKDQDNVGAWHSLIDAYDYIDISIKVIDIYSGHLEDKEKEELKQTHGIYIIKQRIEKLENAIFRPQKIYNSSGLVETIGNCSICGAVFHKCDHNEGDIIMGRLCRRVNREIIRADHAAIVTDPKDRRCIFTSTFDEHGTSIDFFSREPLIEPKEENTYMGIMQVFSDIDID